MTGVLRGVIAGCGYFSRHHLEAWRRIEGVEITATCDSDPARARAAGLAAYTSADQMLEKERPHFLDIVTRPETHLELIRTAASRGVAVICQKPLAPVWGEAAEVLRIARSAGIRVMAHENWRWQPWYREAARLIWQGAIGQPQAYCLRMRHHEGRGDDPFPSQPYFRDMPRFLVYEILIHHLDTARFLFGEIETVCAELARLNPAMRGEDRAVITVRHQSGLTGVIDGHTLNPSASGVALGDAWFEGGNGRLALDPNGNLWTERGCVWRNDVAAGYRGDSVRAAQAHFIECLRSGAPFETDIEEYLRSMAAMEACYLSAKRKATVSPREFLADSQSE